MFDIAGLGCLNMQGGGGRNDCHDRCIEDQPVLRDGFQVLRGDEDEQNKTQISLKKLEAVRRRCAEGRGGCGLGQKLLRELMRAFTSTWKRINCESSLRLTTSSSDKGCSCRVVSSVISQC